MSLRKLIAIFVLGLVAAILILDQSPAQARDRFDVRPSIIGGTPDGVAAKLDSFIDLQVPPGDSPHPLVVLTPGCLGWHPHHKKWQTKLLKKGFAVLHVDSFGARGIKGRGRLETEVCWGVRVPGSERAGDLMAVLSQVWKRPDIQPTMTILMGWSHGGWAVMDFLIMTERNLVPSNLSSLPDVDVNNILAAFLFYPYCSDKSLSGKKGFPASVDVRVFHGTADKVTSPGACRARVNALANSGATIEFLPLSDARHWFDNYTQPKVYDREATAEVDAQIEQKLDQILYGTNINWMFKP